MLAHRGRRLGNQLTDNFGQNVVHVFLATGVAEVFGLVRRNFTNPIHELPDEHKEAGYESIELLPAGRTPGVVVPFAETVHAHSSDLDRYHSMVLRSPLSRDVAGSQPRSISALVPSTNLRGWPSGLEVSQVILPS